MKKFIHLHTHSHYSLLNALPKIPELIGKAKEDEMEALALTDNGNLYGAIEFYKKCLEAEIKPIIGIDTYLSARTRFDKQAGLDNKRSRLILLAKNADGYKNLLKLVTLSYLEGFYYKPRLDNELLEKYNKSLIAIIPSFSGDVASYLKQKDEDKAQKRIGWYKKIFGDENVFLEITHHPEISGHQENMKAIIGFSQKTNTPMVAAHDVYYLNPEDRKARETLISVQTNRPVNDTGNFNEEEDFSFISTKQANKYFKDIPEALENTEKIANMCNLEIELGKWVFPHIEVAKGKTHNEELRILVEKGLSERGVEKTSEVKERIEYELNIIFNKGYSPYFLIVADLLREAHSRGIHTTIRGSVAGSLITYLAGITNLNPLEYELRFERFLNPDRPSAPDIDMDFADDRRDEILQYAREKYGNDKVAQIGTFGTMMARGAVRDVARALGYSYNTGDRIAKLIPFGSQGMPMTIEKAMEVEPDLSEMYKKEDDVREIIDMAKKIEGCARHISVHAAGVVISPEPLYNYTPLQYDSKGEKKVITQYDMHSVEDAGLIKFDFLGLKNLAILSDAVKNVKKHYGIDMDIENIPMNDDKTFEMLSRGETVGLFQLNGAGMTHYLMELKPTSIHDINAMVALYRPGPMDFIPEYIKRKNNPHLIKYPHESMKNILEKSYGLLIYQEDVMMTAIKLANYSWLEADAFRKAMGKKIPELMKEQEEKFKKGCMENNIPKETAEDLWERIKPFALYAFNKAHAASYGRVAYQTSYMKANFPAVYMASVLTADSGDVDKISEIIEECKRMKISVLPPDINESQGEFTVVKSDRTDSTEGEEEIRFGLYTIKNFGEGIADSIIEEREKSGKFKSLSEFISRINDKNLNKKSLEALIKSGALDSLGKRNQMLVNLDKILHFKKELSNAPVGQDSLFGNTNEVNNIDLDEAPPAKKEDMLSWEKELLGLYISGHPLDKIKDKLNKHNNPIKKVKEKLKEGMATVIAGLIHDKRELYTKKGEKMMFVNVQDYEDSIDVVIFPRVLDKYSELLELENCVAIKGKFSKRNGGDSIIADIVKKI